jgi:hypothetical protein
MKGWQLGVAWVLGTLCLAASVAVVVLSRDNQKLQARVQTQRTTLESGILGPRGQQIGVSILQDMANTAQANAAMRGLLGRHGYQVQTQTVARQSAPAAATATNPAVSVQGALP